MCYYYPDGYSIIWNESTPKARKEYKCQECKLPIQTGEQYFKIDSLFDGHWETFKIHQSCQDYRLEIYKHEREEGCSSSESWPPITDLGETMEERLRQEEDKELWLKRVQ